VQKKARIECGLCPVHRRKRSTAILIAWGLALLGLVMTIGGISWAAQSRANENTGLVTALAGVVVLIIAAVYGLIAPRALFPKKIDNQYAWMKGAGPEFLNNFPAIQR
jgi:hypothetical protein